MCKAILLVCCMTAVLFWVAYEIEHFEQVKVDCAKDQNIRRAEYERVCTGHTGVPSVEIAKVCADLEVKMRGDSPTSCANADFWETVIFMRLPWAIVGLARSLGSWIEVNIDGIKSVGLICFVFGILAVALLFRLFGLGFVSRATPHYYPEEHRPRRPPPNYQQYEDSYHAPRRSLSSSEYWEQEPDGVMIPYNRRTHRASRSR